MNGRKLLLAGALICLSVMAGTVRARASEIPAWRVLTSYPYPTMDHTYHSAGMTYDGEHILFLAQRSYSEYIYALDPMTGEIQNQFIPSGLMVILGMSWDGQYIIATNGSPPYGRVNFVDPLSRATVNSFLYPEGTKQWVEGVAYDGHSIFLASTDRGHDHVVSEVDAITGELLNSYVTDHDLYGLAWGGGDIMFGAVMKGRKIVAFDKNTGETLYTTESPGVGWCQAVAFDGTHLFVAIPGDQLGSSKIYVLIPEPASLGLLALGGIVLLKRRRAGQRNARPGRVVEVLQR